MNPPRATMRLQFHKGFTFDDAARQVSYLAALGVTSLCFADHDGAGGLDARL
jgi:(1->4)-alpha-D-glucan 1-alpha-D-glucosylmutase